MVPVATALNSAGDAESSDLTTVNWPGMISSDCTAIDPGKPGSDWPPSMPGMFRKINAAGALDALKERNVINTALLNIHWRKELRAGIESAPLQEWAARG